MEGRWGRREALVYAPATAKTDLSPVVFAFHGHGGTMKYAANKFRFHKLWPEAIVVYMQGLKTPGTIVDPQGKWPGWQKTFGDQGDRDLKFFDAALATLKKDYNVDAKRIYATGHSNGGGFTYLLWAARGDVLAAVAPCAAAALIGNGALPDDLPAALARQAEASRRSMKNLKPKPVLHMAGEADPLGEIRLAATDHRRSAEDQRLRRGQALGRALHDLSFQVRYAGRDVHSLRGPSATG